MTEILLESFYPTFVDMLNGNGLDLVGQCVQVGVYNELVEDQWRVEDFDCKENAALCVASSKALWPKFLSYIRGLKEAGKQVPQNPIDDYIIELLHDLVKKLKDNGMLNSTMAYKIYTDWNQEDPCHLQTFGQISGIAKYVPPPVMWSAHPKYGIWFAFRAVIIFDGVKAPAGIAPTPPDVFTEEMIAKVREYAANHRTWWRNAEESRAYRNIVRSGEDIEYSEEQLNYHAIAHSDYKTRAEYLLSLV